MPGDTSPDPVVLLTDQKYPKVAGGFRIPPEPLAAPQTPEGFPFGKLSVPRPRGFGRAPMSARRRHFGAQPPKAALSAEMGARITLVPSTAPFFFKRKVGLKETGFLREQGAFIRPPTS